MFSLRHLVLFALCASLLSTPADAVAAAHQTVPSIPSTFQTKQAGKYSIVLRTPPEGIYAGEAIDVEFRISDTSKVDPVFGATGVRNVQSKVIITMPEMESMPESRPKIHTEGVPGDYGIECFFPHGGEYKLDLILTIPGETTPLRVSYLVDVLDEAPAGKRKVAPKPYTVDVKSKSTPKSNDPTMLQFSIRDTKSRALVRDFDIAHTKPFHLLMVSKDLSWYAHEHPEQQPDGTFQHQQSFPAGGLYYLYADVAPRNAGSQILMTSIKVNGPTRPPVPLVPSGNTMTVSNMKAVLGGAARLPIGKGAQVTFQLTDTGTGDAVTDLEPYLGAYGHLIIIHADGQTVVHSHPAEDKAGIAQSKRGIVMFNARIPKPGIYKIWGQFQRAGSVITIPFVITVGGAK